MRGCAGPSHSPSPVSRYPISDPVDSTGVGGHWLGGPTAPKGMCRFRGGWRVCLPAYPWRGLYRPRNRVACSRAVKVVYWGSHLEDHGRAGGPLVMPSWIAERYWGRVAASVECRPYPVSVSRIGRIAYRFGCLTRRGSDVVAVIPKVVLHFILSAALSAHSP